MVAVVLTPASGGLDIGTSELNTSSWTWSAVVDTGLGGGGTSTMLSLRTRGNELRRLKLVSWTSQPWPGRSSPAIDGSMSGRRHVIGLVQDMVSGCRADDPGSAFGDREPEQRQRCVGESVGWEVRGLRKDRRRTIPKRMNMKPREMARAR